MASPDSSLGLLVELSNALQAAKIIADHLALAASCTAHDARAITQHLDRVAMALQRTRAEGEPLEPVVGPDPRD